MSASERATKALIARSFNSNQLTVIDMEGNDITPTFVASQLKPYMDIMSNHRAVMGQVTDQKVRETLSSRASGLTLTGDSVPLTAKERNADKEIVQRAMAESVIHEATKDFYPWWDLPRAFFSRKGVSGRMGGFAAVAELIDPEQKFWKAPKEAPKEKLISTLEGFGYSTDNPNFKDSLYEEDSFGKWIKRFVDGLQMRTLIKTVATIGGYSESLMSVFSLAASERSRHDENARKLSLLARASGRYNEGGLGQAMGMLRNMGDATVGERIRELQQQDPQESTDYNNMLKYMKLGFEYERLGELISDQKGDAPQYLVDLIKEKEEEMAKMKEVMPEYGFDAMWEGEIGVLQGLKLFATEMGSRYFYNFNNLAKGAWELPSSYVPAEAKAIGLGVEALVAPSAFLTTLTTATGGMMGRSAFHRQLASITGQQVRYPVFANDATVAFRRTGEGERVKIAQHDRELRFVSEPGTYNGHQVLGYAYSSMPRNLAMRQASLIGLTEGAIEAVQLRFVGSRGLFPVLRTVVQRVNSKVLSRQGLTKIALRNAGALLTETGYQVGTEVAQESAQYLLEIYHEELSNVLGNTEYADRRGQIWEIIKETVNQSVLGLGVAALPGRSIQTIVNLTSHQKNLSMNRESEATIDRVNSRFPQVGIPISDKVKTAIDEQRSKLEKQVEQVIPAEHREEVLRRIEEGDLTAKEKGQEWEKQWNEAEQSARDKINMGQQELEALHRAKAAIENQTIVADTRAANAKNEPLGKDVESHSRIQQRYFDDEVGNLSEQHREAVYVQTLENKIKLHEEMLLEAKEKDELSPTYILELTGNIKKWKGQLAEDIKLLGSTDASVYRVEGDKDAPVITLTREGKGSKTAWTVSIANKGATATPQTFATAHEAIASITGNTPVNGMLSYQTSMATIAGSLGYTRVGAKITTQEQRTKAIITADPQETFEALTTEQQEGQTAINKKIDSVPVANASKGRAVVKEPVTPKPYTEKELTENKKITRRFLKDQLTKLAGKKMPNFNINDSRPVLIRKFAEAKTPKPTTLGQHINSRSKDSAIVKVRGSLDKKLVEGQVSTVLKKRVGNLRRDITKQIRRLRDQGNLHDTSAYVAEMEFFLGQLDRVQNTTDPQPEVETAYKNILSQLRKVKSGLPPWAKGAKDTLTSLGNSHKSKQGAMGADKYNEITLAEAEAVADLFILMSQNDLNANTVYFNRKPESLDRVVDEVIAGMKLPEWLGDREVSKMNKKQITKKLKEIVALSASGQAYIDLFFPKGSAANQIFLLSQATSRQKATFRKLINTLKIYRRGLPNADMGSKKLQAYFNEQKDEYKLNTGKQTSDGKDLEISLTRGEVMALYMHLQSPDNARHVTEGGFSLRDRPDDVILLEGSQIEEARQVAIEEVENDTSLKEKQRDNLIKKINDGKRDGEFRKQILTEFAEEALDANDMNELEAVRKFFHNQYEMIDKVFRVRQGRRLPRILNYFTIRTIKKARTAEEIKLDLDDSLKAPRDVRDDMSNQSHMPESFTKDRINSKVPIHLDTLPNSVSRSAEDASVYIGLSQQMGDATKIFKRIRVSMAEKYGSEVADMFDQRLDDIIRESHSQTLIDRIIRVLRQNAGKAVLSLNPGVAIIQSASYTAAAAYVDEALLLNITGSKDGTTRAQWKDFFTERSGIYSDRVLGYVSRDISPTLGARQRDTTIFTGKIDKSLTDKGLWGIRSVDLATVHNIMVAAFKEAEGFIETNNFNAKNGQLLEFTGVDANTIRQLKEQGDWNALTDIMVRYAETVIERTQPMFDPSQRSALSRTKNEIVKTVTAFRGWGDASFRTAMIEMGRGLKGEPGSGLRVTKWFISNVFISALAMYMIHGARTAFRNVVTGRENEPESYWNKLLDATFGPIPFLREVWGSAEGFIEKNGGAARGPSTGLALQGIEDTVDLINALKRMIDAEKGSETQRKHAERAVEEGVKALLYFSGFPYVLNVPLQAALGRD